VPDVVIVGAGQAGLSASACLAQRGIDHVVLEKSGIGASWRHQRWDSFCLVTPNWTVRLPGQEYAGPELHAFMSGAGFVTFLEEYAARFEIPIRQPVTATAAQQTEHGWHLETTAGSLDSRALIVATSNYQTPFIPDFAAAMPLQIKSLSAADYRNAAQLPPGRVLVVGSAQSGGQIVEDLMIAGREVILSVSHAGRAPRRYRGRDAIEWQDMIGFLDRPAAALDDPRKRFGGEPHLTGRDGGHTVSLQNFQAQGVRLIGRVEDIQGFTLYLKADLRDNMRAADRFAANFCGDVDSYIRRNGLTAPPDDGEPAHAPIADFERYDEPVRLDLEEEGVSAVVWATGFRFDYAWIGADVFDAFGYPLTARGETAAAGLYFLGLNYLHSRKSGIIYGVGQDAEHVASRIRLYLDNSRS